MTAYAHLLIYLAVVAALWIAFRLHKHRRERSKPKLGDADAYDGNLVIPPVGRRYGHGAARGSHSSGHAVHEGSHVSHGGAHGGHPLMGGGHHL